MSGLVQFLKDFFRGYSVLGGVRSPKWGKVRKDFININPFCAVCYTKKRLEAHHIIPVNIDKSKELDPTNLIVLCRSDHLLYGHLNSWKSFNYDVRKDAEIWRQKILNRP